MYINWSQLDIQSSSYNNIREPRHIAILLQTSGQSAQLMVLSYRPLGKTKKKVELEIKSNSILRHTSFTTHPFDPYIKAQLISTLTSAGYHPVLIIW